jgi:copper transport protein
MRQHEARLRASAHASWRSFSPLAALGVGLLLTTGLYNMGGQVASLDALLTTRYGQGLVSKIGLMLLIGLFGLLNLRCVQAGRWPAWLRAEVIAGGLILLATALITATPPPRGVEFTIAPDTVPTALSQTVDDLVVTLSVKPNRPGPNVFTVHSASTRRPPPADILRVLLRFTYLEQEIGTVSATAQAVEPGRYILTDHPLPLAGAWQIEVVTRRRGLEDSVARFHWIVAPPGVLKPVVLSKQSLARPLTFAGAGSLVALLVAVLGVRWRATQPKRENAP